MTIQEKLQFIQRLSGYSQERLARELGVSFATLNSWIRDRSVPRQNAKERIDKLYREITGQQVVPLDVLQAKQGIIFQKSRTHKNILKKILGSPDLYDTFLLSLTYNTNRIEGSTLTESETAAILFEDAALPSKSLTEQLEARNHKTALQYLFGYIIRSSKIDEKLILKLHSILMNGIRDDAGMYRRHAVRIAGSNVPTANYARVPELVKRLIRDINRSSKDAVFHTASIHSRFEQIHPFSDGNGRIGRLIMHAMALQKNLPPVVVRQEKRRLYYSALQKAQLKDDTTLLEDFIADGILEGFDIVERKK